MPGDAAPDMVGFEWSPTTGPDTTELQGGSNGWCVRDAFSQLLEWAPNSPNWSRFTEWPKGEDIPRLAAHLGLTVLEIPRHWNELIRLSFHPGVAVFDFPSEQASHVVYVHDARWLLHHWPEPGGHPIEASKRSLWAYGWPLDRRYLTRGPVLGAVIIDERQAARPASPLRTNLNSGP